MRRTYVRSHGHHRAFGNWIWHSYSYFARLMQTNRSKRPCSYAAFFYAQWRLSHFFQSPEVSYAKILLLMFELSWQDLVFMLGNIVFFVALIPSIISENKPSKWTSLSTALVMSLYVITYYSLSLTYATVTGAIATTAWWILYLQKRNS